MALNNLRNSLIVEILVYLPIHEVVQLEILCKKIAQALTEQSYLVTQSVKRQLRIPVLPDDLSYTHLKKILRSLQQSSGADLHVCAYYTNGKVWMNNINYSIDKIFNLNDHYSTYCSQSFSENVLVKGIFCKDFNSNKLIPKAIEKHARNNEILFSGKLAKVQAYKEEQQYETML